MTPARKLPAQSGAPADVQTYFDMQRDEMRASIPRLNESISKMLTLCTAMAGGSLLFLKDELCVSAARIIAAAFFFLALAVAAYGLIPITGEVSSKPEVFSQYRKEGIAQKRWLLQTICFLTCLGLATAIIGATIRAINPL